MTWWPFCAPWARKKSTSPAAVPSGFRHHPGHYCPLTSCTFPGPASPEAGLRPEPHLMLWCNSEIGRRRLVTSSLLAARASVESDPVDSHLSSGPAICYESPEGPGP